MYRTCVREGYCEISLKNLNSGLNGAPWPAEPAIASASRAYWGAATRGLMKLQRKTVARALHTAQLRICSGVDGAGGRSGRGDGEGCDCEGGAHRSARVKSPCQRSHASGHTSGRTEQQYSLNTWGPLGYAGKQCLDIVLQT